MIPGTRLPRRGRAIAAVVVAPLVVATLAVAYAFVGHQLVLAGAATAMVAPPLVSTTGSDAGSPDASEAGDASAPASAISVAGSAILYESIGNDEATSMSSPSPLTSSSLDAEELVHRRLPRDKDAVTHSRFDRENLIDRHPVPDRGAITHSDFDHEDLVDRHPVPDRGAITHSDFDDEDLVDSHPVTR